MKWADGNALLPSTVRVMKWAGRETEDECRVQAFGAFALEDTEHEMCCKITIPQ